MTRPFSPTINSTTTVPVWPLARASAGYDGACIRPPERRFASELPEPLFTPATKADVGDHDVNITMHEMSERIGRENAELMLDLSMMVYDRASRHAEGQGLILADTKFEFGVTAEGILLADEVLTPDSSRFWAQNGYEAGRPQNSFDKQFVRDYLVDSHWNQQAPAPPLPPDIVAKTQEKYLEAFRRITGCQSPE